MGKKPKPEAEIPPVNSFVLKSEPEPLFKENTRLRDTGFNQLRNYLGGAEGGGSVSFHL